MQIDQQVSDVTQLFSEPAMDQLMDQYGVQETFEDDSEEPPVPLDDAEVSSFLTRMYSDALGGDYDDELAQDRAKALNYYYGRPRGDEVGGRSQVQSLDVADMTEALLAQIMPLFTGSTIAQFETSDPMEADQVRLESEYCNWVIMQKNHGYVTLQDAIKNALLLKNGVLKVYPETKHIPKTEAYEFVSPYERAALLEPSEPGEEVYIVAEETTEQEGASHIMIRRVRTETKLCVESIPLDEFSVIGSHSSPVLNDCEYCCHTRLMTRSELIEAGFDPEQVEKLTADGSMESETVEALARKLYHKEYSSSSPDKANNKITVQDHCVRMDYDQDGYAELRRVVTAGTTQSTILYNEEVPFVFFASGTGYMQSGQWVGLSIYDKLKEVQDQKTGFLRQYMDNMNLMNNRRMGVLDRGRVNLDDALQSFPGSMVRMKSPDALFPIPVDDIGGSSLQALNYLDQVRTDRAGASLDMQSQQASIPTDTAHGVERQISAKEMMAAQITRNLCETLIRSLFLLVHKSLKEYFPDSAPVPLLVKQQMEQQQQQAQQQAQQASQEMAPDMAQPAPPTQAPTEIAPGGWSERDNVIITTGLSQGEKLKQQQAYGAVINFHQTMKSGGDNGVIVSPGAEYEAYIEFCRAAGIQSPQRFFLNPASPQSQQTQTQNAQNAQKQMEEQSQQTQVTLDAQSTLARAEEMKAEAAQQKNQMQGQIESLKLQLQQAKDEATLAKDASDVQFNYDKLAADIALKMAEMEQVGNQQENENFLENRETVRQ